ncbi:MAG: 50S ribosome-binding GTPase [Magnetococcales bacterium]|nr:50S ribosome-binding GTPase [Magnetococcales bacterium]
MGRFRYVKFFLALVVLLLTALSLFLILHLSDTALSVWEKLSQGSPWLLYGYFAGVGVVALAGLVIIWRILRPKHADVSHVRCAESAEPVPLPDQKQVETRIERNSSAGADVAVAKAELAELTRRKVAGEVHLALFGEVNAGKSTLMKALLPEAHAHTSPVAGATQTIEHLIWQTPAGDQLIISDLPGVNEVRMEQGNADALARSAREEAIRAHIVLYLCDGDLTRDQLDELKSLLHLEKPMVIGLNKIDRYHADEQHAILGRIHQHIQQLTPKRTPPVVALSAGGVRDIFRLGANGEEIREQRPIPANLEALITALQSELNQDATLLNSLRDGAVFAMAARKLDESLSKHRYQRSSELAGAYSRKAVVGALAAVTPGMDLVVQGVLGVAMVRELCALYDVPLTKLEAEKLLKSLDSRISRTVPLLMTVIGNVLKAFPGVGTVAGGLLHAVAYGILFDSLTRALSRTLESRGTLDIEPAARLFQEQIAMDLEDRTKGLIKIGLEYLISRKGSERGEKS